MLSDESSSDSETGRFKCRSKKEDFQTKSSHRDDNLRSVGRSRPSENDRFRRDIDKIRDERDRFERHSRDRPRYSRHSPIRRRPSRDRSPYRRSRDRERPRHRGDSPGRSRPRDYRSSSRDRKRRSRSHKSPEQKRELKAEIKRNTKDEPAPSSKENIEKPAKKSRERSLSFDKVKRSEIHKPLAPQKKKSSSPIVIEEHDSDSEEVQPGSYYNMIPAVVEKKEKKEESPKEIVKEKSEESSEIDSSDDEKLRAKLLNLEKELHKTKKRKHKRRHKKKNAKSSKERDPTTVEVTSTTDIDKADEAGSQTEIIEVTSTQKSNQKETSEEGEISTDDDSQQNDIEIDPTDLRHKLKRSKVGTNSERESPSVGICGPALPPHLQKRYERSNSPGTEGPALPPHLRDKPKTLGPAIPEDMRKVLAEQDPDEVKYVSSDEDTGIGPLPTSLEDKWSDAHKRLEERALDIKIKKLDGHSLQSRDVKSREEWMLELPEAKAKILGLEARSFRAKEGPDMSDRSSWTDTPEEKARKAAGVQKEEDPEVSLQRAARARHIANRDDEHEKAVKKHKKKHKREESLLELHQKKLKKKKKKDEKEDGKSERRPFSREVDLQVNRFDEAQKKSIIKKAQELNTRFSRGEAKFL